MKRPEEPVRPSHIVGRIKASADPAGTPSEHEWQVRDDVAQTKLSDVISTAANGQRFTDEWPRDVRVLRPCFGAVIELFISLPVAEGFGRGLRKSDAVPRQQRELTRG